MEKENKEIIENAEQKGNNTEEKEQPDKKNNNKKKILLVTLGIILALCLGIFIFIRINTTEKHMYEEVENLGEREGVSFDNLLLSSTIGLYDNSLGEYEHKYLCIFNTGDVYCFEWTMLNSWNVYYKNDDHRRGYDETNWSKTENAVYLGRLSNEETSLLIQYIQNFDTKKYYNEMEAPEVPDNDEKKWQTEETENENYIWKYYNVRLYQHGQNGKIMEYRIMIESCDMIYLGDNIYEKGELWEKSYDENAIAALELFESSGFYDRWVAMCLNNG